MFELRRFHCAFICTLYKLNVRNSDSFNVMIHFPLPAVVGFEHVQYYIGENDSTVEVCAVTQGFGFTLRIATADNTAKGAY